VSAPHEARRREIVAAARRWLGTPYRHQASCRGAGADCLGLVRGVWREVIGPEPEAAPAYTPDWDEAVGAEVLLGGAQRLLLPAGPGPVRAGEVLVFRMRAGAVAKHLAIAGGAQSMIHAYSGRGVVETPLGPPMMRRLAARFEFPDRGA